MRLASDPQPVVPQPVPEPEPKLVPEPPAPVQEVPKPESKPKPERHREIKLQTPKPETRPATVPVTSAPRAAFHSNPIYPPRASALGIVGSVNVMCDVNAEGQVENIRIVSAQPAQYV